VPDLSGYTLEDAYKTLSYMGLNMQAENIGNVVAQSPAPGTKVPKGSIVKIELINRDTETLG
jgi:stage V sporulation protein D (sporulation-specific penicillin-binding protein)